MSKVRSMKKKNVEREVWNRVQRISGTDLNYWIKHPFEFSDPILKPEYL